MCAGVLLAKKMLESSGAAGAVISPVGAMALSDGKKGGGSGSSARLAKRGTTLPATALMAAAPTSFGAPA